MADEPDRALIITGIVGAAALVGLTLYFISKGGSAQAAPSTPATTDKAAAPTTPAAPATTYALSLSSDQNISLQAGQTVLVQLPAPPAGSTGWTPEVQNHDGQAGYLPAAPGQPPNSFVVTAISKGVSVIGFAPSSQFGPGGVAFSLAISVQ